MIIKIYLLKNKDEVRDILWKLDNWLNIYRYMRAHAMRLMTVFYNGWRWVHTLNEYHTPYRYCI